MLTQSIVSEIRNLHIIGNACLSKSLIVHNLLLTNSLAGVSILDPVGIKGYNMSKSLYKIIVVGGGHAGYEAALASARMGVKTLLITLDKKLIGRLPCNPAVGGIAKSHLVSELDALGGELGRNTDYTGIQYRMLNTRKGPIILLNQIQ